MRGQVVAEDCPMPLAHEFLLIRRRDRDQRPTMMTYRISNEYIFGFLATLCSSDVQLESIVLSQNSFELFNSP